MGGRHPRSAVRCQCAPDGLYCILPSKLRGLASLLFIHICAAPYVLIVPTPTLTRLILNTRLCAVMLQRMLKLGAVFLLCLPQSPKRNGNEEPTWCCPKLFWLLILALAVSHGLVVQCTISKTVPICSSTIWKYNGLKAPTAAILGVRNTWALISVNMEQRVTCMVSAR